MDYLIPAAYTGISSWADHRRRNPPSSEPGTDYYMPTGTPLGAPTACRVVAVGGSIYPATGRFVVVDDGTRWIRFLHLSQWQCRVGDDLDPGDTFALSGASGYGSELFGEPSRNTAFWNNTGGDHVHVTAFSGRGYPPVWNGSGTVDFHALTHDKGFLMALNDKQQAQMYDALVKGGYGGYYSTDAIVNILRGELAPAIASIAAGGILYPGKPYLAFEAIANVIREDDGTGVAIDEAEVAAHLAPVLAPLIAENLGTLTDQTVDDLAKRLLDEQSKRLAQ